MRTVGTGTPAGQLKLALISGLKYFFRMFTILYRIPPPDNLNVGNLLPHILASTFRALEILFFMFRYRDKQGERLIAFLALKLVDGHVMSPFLNPIV